MKKHCLLLNVVTDPKGGKRDDYIVSVSEHRPPVWWRKWKSRAKPKPGRIVAQGAGFNLPVPLDSQWVMGDPSEPKPEQVWIALRDTTPSTVEIEDPETGKPKFFDDEKSAMDYILSR